MRESRTSGSVRAKAEWLSYSTVIFARKRWAALALQEVDRPALLVDGSKQPLPPRRRIRHHLLRLAVPDGIFAVPAEALQNDEGMATASLPQPPHPHAAARLEIIGRELYSLEKRHVC
jgi:hypothetical protein